MSLHCDFLSMSTFLSFFSPVFTEDVFLIKINELRQKLPTLYDGDLSMETRIFQIKKNYEISKILNYDILNVNYSRNLQ